MKRTGLLEFTVEGDLYLDIPMDIRFFIGCSFNHVINVKGNVFFEVDSKPDNLKEEDDYIKFSEFTKEFGPVYNIIAFYKDI